MTSTDDLKLLLAQPENIRLGMDIANTFEEVKKKLHERFWSIVQSQLHAVIKNLTLENSWSSIYDRSKPECYITPKDIQSGGGKLALGVFTENSKLTYGLGFLLRQETDWPNELQTLRRTLVAAYGDVPDKFKDWWVYRRECSVKPETADFLVGISKDVEGFARQFTELTLGILSTQEELVLAAGRILSA